MPDGRTTLQAYETANGPLPETLVIGTPSGGEHRVFRGRAPTSTGHDGIDFRGGRGEGKGLGYGLLPPSHTKDGPNTVEGDYTVKHKARPAEAPAALIDFATSRISRAKRASVAGPSVDHDKPVNLDRATDWIERQPPVAEGARNDTAFKHACTLLDLGLSEDTACGLLSEWNDRNPSPLDEDEVEQVVASAANNRENRGTTPLALASSTLEHPAFKSTVEAATAKAKAEVDERVARFRGRDLVAYAALPAPVFHDVHGLLPKHPGGSLGLVTGKSGAGKSTVLAALAFEAMQRGSKVLYLAGEGGYGMGKMRLPAEALVRGIDLADLEDKLRLVDAVPNLTDKHDMDALLEAHADFRPDLVIWDTLATTIPGQDENNAAVASLFTGGGPVRSKIGRTWNATNVFAAHLGKDPTHGTRGSSGFEANADFVLTLTADKAASAVKLHVTKMRDAPDDFDVHFKIGKPTGGVPIASYITADQYRALSPSDPSNAQHDVFHALRALCGASGQPVTTAVLADALTPPVEGESPEDRQKRIKKRELALTRQVRPNRMTKRPGPLVAYVRSDADGDPVKPFEWLFPGEPEDDDD